MMPLRLLPFCAALVLGSYVLANAQEMDKELSDFADRIAVPISTHGRKKVTVLDFIDLQGGASELGKYVAEELTVDLVMGKRDFAVLDRANLKSILAEHKLTATGLVDPANAKKLGQFAGVDAIILGTIIPMDQKISLTAKVITTDTAEIIGAAKAEFKTDSTAQKLLAKPAAETEENDVTAAPKKKEFPSLIRSFGELRVELQPLEIVSGNRLQATMIFTNTNPSRSIWVALGADLMSNMNGRLTDPGGTQLRPWRGSTSGIALGTYTRYGYVPNSFSPATELRPRDSITATFQFAAPNGATPAPGDYRVQLELLVGHQYSQAATGVQMNNLVGQIHGE